MSNKLLIIADIEDKCAASARGLQLADEMDLIPEVVAFTHTDIKRLKVDKDSGAAIKAQLMAERRSTITQRINKLAGDNNGIKINIVWAESIHEWISKRVAGGDYMVVVKSRHKSESFGHTSTDWHLLRTCPVPVLLVNKKRWTKDASILATVDLGATGKTKQKLNLDVVLEARHYAEVLNMELKVLCVLEVPTLLSDLDLVDPKTYAQERQKMQLPVMQELADQSGLPTSAFVFKRGPVAKTIVSEAANNKAQLVVMGSVGRKGVKAQLIGNEAERVLGLLKTDTLTLKP